MPQINLKIVVPSYNCEKWISKCLSSIETQTFKDFDVCIIDDKSDVDKQREIIQKFCEKNNWKYIFNAERKFALFNIRLGIEHICHDDNDVIILVDGDDWLYDNDVFDKINKLYSEKDIYMSYGQYIRSETKSTSKYFAFKPSDEIVEKKLYRRVPWMFTHLKTFKYGLFKKIREKHFIDIGGKYFRTTYDLAIMFPIVEMAGKKFECVNDILYVYNEDNPISDYKAHRAEQARVDGLIRSFPVYPTMTI